MLAYNEMVLARMRNEELSQVRQRAEIEPVTVHTNVIVDAVTAIKAAFAPRKQVVRPVVRRTLATE